MIQHTFKSFYRLEARLLWPLSTLCSPNMLSRGASNASRRPQRSKSTPSFRPRAVTADECNIDESETLHQDALTAANLAYERAKERKKTQKGATTGDGEREPKKASVDIPNLGRRQSVRFVGPNAVPTRARSITRREAFDYKANHESHRQSYSSCLADPSFLSNEDSVIALPDDFGEVYVASEPSSYRRLRKAKSMFSPGKAPSAVIASGTPNSKRGFQRCSLQSSDAVGEPIRVPDPRLKRSYSFLRGVTDRLSTANRQYAAHDAAIELARNTYLQQVEQQKLNEQPPFLHLGRRAKTQKVFRRTVRTSSTNSYGSAISSPLSSEELKRPKGLGSMARTISQTWKDKINQVFKRSSNDRGIPVQHLDATHAHYGDRTPASDGSAQRLPPFPEPNAELLRRVGSRDSSLHSRPFMFNKSPRASSIRSLSSDEEESNDKSRVTSWTNSTAANTINMPNFVERKRLSIIREDGGPHQSSSCTQQRDDSGNGYATFWEPLKQGSASHVETKRIFSALQREINQNNRKATTDDSDSGTNSDSDRQRKNQPRSIPGRRSSNRSGVRRVSIAPEAIHHNQNLKVSTSGILNFPAGNCVDHSLPQNTTKTSRSEYPQSYEDIQERLTPQEIANVNESSVFVSKRPLREVKSAFFPPSTRIERCNMSPFRRVMHAGSEDEDAAIRSDFADQRAMIGSRIRNGSVAGSESVYSRSSSDQMTKAASSSLSLAGSESSGKLGTAVIIASRPSTQQPSARPVFPQEYSSANYSGAWKDFLASQVASLEDTGRPHGLVGEDFSAKERGHRKESAQLDGDDMKIGTSRMPAIVPIQPLGILQGNSIGRPRSMGEMVPFSNQHNPKRFRDRQNENTPVTPYLVSSQKQSNAEAGVSSSGTVKCPPSGSRQRPLQASLDSRNDSNNASATESPRVSPERTERLRRLQSSSSATLRKTSSNYENWALNNTINNAGHESDGSRHPMHTLAGKNHKLVDSFLKDRRNQMRISEESAIEPAFL